MFYEIQNKVFGNIVEKNPPKLKINYYCIYLANPTLAEKKEQSVGYFVQHFQL